jgi:hypothetical protein
MLDVNYVLEQQGSEAPLQMEETVKTVTHPIGLPLEFIFLSRSSLAHHNEGSRHGFPPRRPGFKAGSGHVGFCDGQKWRWGRFSPRTSVSPANLHSICSPQSSSLSPEAGTIGQLWPQCQ